MHGLVGLAVVELHVEPLRANVGLQILVPVHLHADGAEVGDAADELLLVGHSVGVAVVDESTRAAAPGEHHRLRPPLEGDEPAVGLVALEDGLGGVFVHAEVGLSDGVELR